MKDSFIHIVPPSTHIDFTERRDFYEVDWSFLHKFLPRIKARAPGSLCQLLCANWNYTKFVNMQHWTTRPADMMRAWRPDLETLLWHGPLVWSPVLRASLFQFCANLKLREFEREETADIMQRGEGKGVSRGRLFSQLNMSMWWYQLVLEATAW